MKCNIKLKKIILISIWLVVWLSIFLFLNPKYNSIPSSNINSAFVNMDPIEQVYVITLDNFKQRYDSVKKTLDSYGINYIKFPGTDGMKLNIIDEDNNVIVGNELKNYTKKISSNTNYHVICSEDTHLLYNSVPFHKHATAGELGCTCSHIRLWQDIVKNNYKYSLILEDDIKVSENFKTNFENVLQNIPTECDIIYIHWMLFYQNGNLKKYYDSLPTERIYNNNYVSYISDVYTDMFSFASYILTLEGAKKFLTLLPDQNYLPIDRLVFYTLIKTGKIKACKANLVHAYSGKRHVMLPDRNLSSVINLYGRRNK